MGRGDRVGELGGDGVRRRGRLGRGLRAPGHGGFDPPARSASAYECYVGDALNWGYRRGLGGRVGERRLQSFRRAGLREFTVRLQRRETKEDLAHGQHGHPPLPRPAQAPPSECESSLSRRGSSAASSPPSCSTPPAAASARTGRCSARLT